MIVKLVVQVKLLPTSEQAAALESTLRSCNEAANWLSAEAFTRQVTSRAGLQALAYADLRARGLSAQPALHVLRKVADAYAALKAQAKAGRLGKPGSKRYAMATSSPITFVRRRLSRLMIAACPGDSTPPRCRSGPPVGG